ncbi:MAG TPA: sigma-54 dependent transcriptional regulator [Pyrinomonadaceae bacterium]|jgi:transcriptional regulator with PAS, ATPase and Fis domain|nr:sigma-54 dependent transcriptional regulator [Pyrinomonadaceae bacterium]
MSRLPPSLVSKDKDNSNAPYNLPLAAMVRALCRAATTGPDLLYEVMLKLTLMIDATAQTYGLSTWTQKTGERPRLKWVEGLDEDEIAEAEMIVASALSAPNRIIEPRSGDQSICLVLSSAVLNREGAAIYGRCVRPLTEAQAKEIRVLSDVAQLAHAHVSLKGDQQPLAKTPPVATTTLPGMVFNSRAMAAVARAVERIKDSESTVLITGESGTGKELVARAIHRLSKRCLAEFIPFNCTAAPSELIESMLFGHRKGAFTGAHADYEGLIRAAEGGTLFLDEIGDLPLALQPKLLRFLQEGEVHTLGERAPRKVKVRVVAATHKDLEREVREGKFREDLFYRVASLSLHVPPLRERPEDTAALISHFLTHYARRNDRAIGGITSEAINVLQNHPWPGNVRELAAEIERLVLYADEGTFITLEHISERMLPESARNALQAKESPADLDHLMEDFERRVIMETLKRHDCNVARTSAALGLGSRQTLYKKLKRLAIDVGDFLQEDTEPGLQLRADRH